MAAMFLVAFILVFRGENVGGDTIHYCRFYDGHGSSGYGTISNYHYLLDVGFVWLCKFLRLFSDERWFFLITTSLLTIIPFLYIVYRDSNSKLLPLCFYMLSFNLLTLSQTAIRQNISIALLLIVFIILTSKNIKGIFKYAIVICFIICSFFLHSTSILSVLLALVVYFIPLRRWSTLLMLGIVLTIMVLKIDITGFVYELVSKNVKISGMTHYISGYAYAIKENKFSLMSLLQISLLTTSALLCSNRIFKGKDRKNFIMKCFFFGGAITIIGNGFVLICRIVYLLTFLGITISLDDYNKKNKLLPRIGFLLCLFSLFIYQILYLSTQRSAVIHDHMIPYNFIFE